MKTVVALLHLCDSLFPIGAFGYSDGLEAATATGLIRTPGDLRSWLDVCLDETIGRADGPTVLQAWTAFSRRDWSTLGALDDEVTALKPSSGARQSSRAMGWRLVTTWHALYPDRGLAHLLDRGGRGTPGPALPVAFGCVCASAGIRARDAAAAFAYTRLAATISAAMRLMPIGQSDAHAQLAGVLGRVPTVVDAMAPRTRVASFAPAMDIALMTQPHLHSRLFRS
jgi:urease accessory protein